MPQQPTASYIDQILSAAISAPASNVTSEADEDTELRHHDERLRVEIDSAKRRAAARYKDKIHANRRAERAEMALKREVRERRGDAAKAYGLFCGYKAALKNLEDTVAQLQRNGSSERCEALEAAATRLEAASAQQEKDAIEAKAEAQKTIDYLNTKLECQKDQIKSNIKQHDENLAEVKRQMDKQCQLRVHVAISQLQATSQSRENENKELKRQLQQSQRLLDQYKVQAQQQGFERGRTQGVPIAAGIHAGFPLQPSQSPVHAKESSRKRRKLNSVGYVVTMRDADNWSNSNRDASVPTSDRKFSHSNPIASSTPSSTPRKKAATARKGQTQYPQQPTTPIRQTATPQHGHPSSTGNSFRTIQGPQYQAVESPLRAFCDSKDFSRFFQVMNSKRIGLGFPVMSHEEAYSAYQQFLANKSEPQSSKSVASHGGIQPSLPQQYLNMTAGTQPVLEQTAGINLGSNQMGAQNGSQASFQLVPTPLGQNYSATLGLPSPLRNPQNRSWETQQPPADAQGHDQSSEHVSPRSAQPIVSSMSVSTASHGADALLSRSSFSSQPLQPMPNQSNAGVEDMQDFPVLDQEDWSLSMPDPGDGFGGFDSGEFTFDDSIFQNFIEDGNTDGFAALNDAPAPSNEVNPQLWNHQEPQSSTMQNDFSLQNALDPALSLPNTMQNPSIGYPPATTQAAFIQQLPTNPTSIPNPVPVPHTPVHPTTSRKCPATTSSTHTTPTPAPPVAVCLHCHESWWNETCDPGEPCQNCIGSRTACERPMCLSFASNTCTNARCPRVHEGDQRYENLVARPKTLKRVGKRDARRESLVEARWWR